MKLSTYLLMDFTDPRKHHWHCVIVVRWCERQCLSMIIVHLLLRSYSKLNPDKMNILQLLYLATKIMFVIIVFILIDLLYYSWVL